MLLLFENKKLLVGIWCIFAYLFAIIYLSLLSSLFQFHHELHWTKVISQENDIIPWLNPMHRKKCYWRKYSLWIILCVIVLILMFCIIYLQFSLKKIKIYPFYKHGIKTNSRRRDKHCFAKYCQSILIKGFLTSSCHELSPRILILK